MGELGGTVLFVPVGVSVLLRLFVRISAGLERVQVEVHVAPHALGLVREGDLLVALLLVAGGECNAAHVHVGPVVPSAALELAKVLEVAVHVGGGLFQDLVLGGVHVTYVAKVPAVLPLLALLLLLAKDLVGQVHMSRVSADA